MSGRRHGLGVAGLSVTLTRHLDRISRRMTEANVPYMDLGREVALFVEMGWWGFLRHDPKMVEAWRMRNMAEVPVPHGMVLQEATYRFDLYILGLAVNVYTQEGLLAPQAIPKDAPLGEELDEVTA